MARESRRPCLKLTTNCKNDEVLPIWLDLAVNAVNMQRSDEKLCLQWNDFRNNASSAFGDLRDDRDFTNVTLVCEDGQEVEAHKVVLIASSPFFLNLLKRNKHPHPLVYMRGLKFENLMSLVDFLYLGEANIYQDYLDSFLVMAEELQVKGLEKKEEEHGDPAAQKISQSSNLTNNHIATFKDNKQGLQSIADMIPITETAVALNNFSGCTDLDELDTKVKSMMTFSENRIQGNSTSQGRARICKVCGKEGQRNNIMIHIEANHINDISIPCNICGKMNQSRNALNKHNRQYHS